MVERMIWNLRHLITVRKWTEKKWSIQKYLEQLPNSIMKNDFFAMKRPLLLSQWLFFYPCSCLDVLIFHWVILRSANARGLNKRNRVSETLFLLEFTRGSFLRHIRNYGVKVLFLFMSIWSFKDNHCWNTFISKNIFWMRRHFKHCLQRQRHLQVYPNR